MPGPRVKIKIRIVVIILSRFPEWYDAPMNRIVIEGLDSSTTDPTPITIDEANLTTDQLRALKDIISTFGSASGIGDFTITLDDPTELNDLFDANITEITFEAEDSVLNSEDPGCWEEANCTNGDEKSVVNALAELVVT